MKSPACPCQSPAFPAIAERSWHLSDFFTFFRYPQTIPPDRGLLSSFSDKKITMSESNFPSPTFTLSSFNSSVPEPSTTTAALDDDFFDDDDFFENDFDDNLFDDDFDDDDFDDDDFDDDFFDRIDGFIDRLVQPRFYLTTYPDVAEAIRNGSFRGDADDHFEEFGGREGRDPSIFYSEQFYLTNNPDVAEAVNRGQFLSGFEHFFSFGAREGRNPSPNFNSNFYLENNPDVAAAVNRGTFNSGFFHFIAFGQFENRQPRPANPPAPVANDPLIGSTTNPAQFASDNGDPLTTGGTTIASEAMPIAPAVPGDRLPDLAAASSGSSPEDLSLFLPNDLEGFAASTSALPTLSDMEANGDRLPLDLF